MIKAITKRERIILFLTAGIMFFAICFNFLIEPVLNKNDQLNQEINMVRAKLKKYILLLAQKEYLEKRYGNKLPAGFNLSAQKEDSLVAALSELENLAKEAGVRIIDIRPEGALKGKAAYKEALIDLRAEGRIEDYLKFIYHLQNSLSLLKIEKIQLTAKPNSEALEGSFTISQVLLD